MSEVYGSTVGTVVGNTSPQDFSFYLKSFKAKLGDIVTVQIDIPSSDSSGRRSVLVWGRITSLTRYNPFLPSEAGLELAEEGLELIDTVLSNSRDQVEGNVLVLGASSPDNIAKLTPLNYPVQPGAKVYLPVKTAVETILIGDEKNTHRLRLGSLIGRSDVNVSLRTNSVVARHMALLAMTGGGKTVAARRIIRELLGARYPLVILDPHGDYLGFWENRALFQKNSVRLFYPYITVNEQNRDVIGFLVSNMTQGFTEPQRAQFENAIEGVELRESVIVTSFIDRIMQKLGDGTGTTKRTISVVKRNLRFVRNQMESMINSNELLRGRLAEYPFEPMPDPLTEPNKYVSPGQASIIYLGGYDHVTQSTIVSLILRHLFEQRASMKGIIPPFLCVVEEAHNFIPSHGEGQAETPSVGIIRKVITEGRKFGVGLLLISQRPSRLDETTLSQCNTFLILRLVNPRDQLFVEKVMENLTKADARLLPGFGPGQGIVSGQAVRFPLAIQVDFDEELVTKSIGDEDFVQAVKDWGASPGGKAAERSRQIEDALANAAEKR